MKSISLVSSVVVSAVLMTASASAMAAAGSVCYNTATSITAGSSGSVSFPQIGNTTVFYCSSGIAASTIPQLSAAGWIIVAIDEVPYSQTLNSNGTVTTSSRTRIIIQK